MISASQSVQNHLPQNVSYTQATSLRQPPPMERINPLTIPSQPINSSVVTRAKQFQYPQQYNQSHLHVSCFSKRNNQVPQQQYQDEHSANQAKRQRKNNYIYHQQ